MIRYQFTTRLIDGKDFVNMGELAVWASKDAEKKLAAVLIQMSMPDGIVSVVTTNGSVTKECGTLKELAGHYVSRTDFLEGE